MARLVDISGQRSGVLTALHPHGRDAYGRALCQCRCDCGQVLVSYSEDLRKARWYLDREIQRSQERNGSNRDRPQEAPS